ncbi:zf-HC2 domain-containing protein [Tepidimicrobium xylanilyticum]|uniref:Putative zinc-finger n=1 Tax=Tepidimicrobium xylanilyticum TaxID=1123352 RepID=A0A1H3E6E8_9FIRM|nr:zf-HC2 domain-containing protein [Tepidimicrobium xylanilyticum]GMG95818.1 hypothetical protein EN5CB1_06440 [Tepidimicrobium xylanilyticum]SDX74187.1 Putative zinc-finger [Tepidimicrobium xylanilyticum]
MKITCNIIGDILPLYVENMVSEDTKKVVEEHIDGCDRCKRQLKGMTSSINIPLETDTASFEKMKATLQKKKIQTIIFSIMLTVSVIVVLISFLTAREYIPYHEGLISLTESSDGIIIAKFNDEVKGYNISTEPSKIGDGFVYYITTWDSFWASSIIKKSVNNTVLNIDGKKIDSIYYYNADGSEDILIYGKDQNPNGGMVSLPRLVLGYYLLLAIALAIISGILTYVYRKKEKIRNIMLKFFLLPVSYILAHILIKGFPASSYSAKRDFLVILFVTISICIASISAINIIKE